MFDPFKQKNKKKKRSLLKLCLYCMLQLGLFFVSLSLLNFAYLFTLIRCKEKNV